MTTQRENERREYEDMARHWAQNQRDHDHDECMRNDNAHTICQHASTKTWKF